MKVARGSALAPRAQSPAQDDGPVAPAPARQEATPDDKPPQSVTHQSGRKAERTHAAARKPPDEAGALLTTDEAAALLHVHPRTVQRLVERGQLCAVHLGSAVRFDPNDVGG